MRRSEPCRAFAAIEGADGNRAGITVVRAYCDGVSGDETDRFIAIFQGSVGMQVDHVSMDRRGRFRRTVGVYAWILAAVLTWPLSGAAQGTDMRLVIRDRAEGGLVFIGTLGGKTTRVEIDGVEAARLAAVRFTVECAVDSECNDQKIDPVEGDDRRVFGEGELKPYLIEAGRQILTPFAHQIRKASRLRIHVPEHLIKIAVDALEFEGVPLYVRLPIVYTVDQEITPARTTLNASSVGLMISDHTADPDRAVFDVGKLFPRSMVHDVEDVDPAKLETLGQVDFAIISAHGRAGYEGRDSIAMSDQSGLPPGVLARMRPQLVYFDSCNLGISLQYMHELRSAGTKYVLAPIISNEAGNSSTLTMTTFFEDFIKGRDPVTALHAARVRAYKMYGRGSLGKQAKGTLLSMNTFFRDVVDGRNPMVALQDARARAVEAHADGRTVSHLWRAFAFRIYALN